VNAGSARTIIDENRYMTLATADETGRPWASPVWFASRDSREFFWVSRPEAQHSRNIALRPQVAIVIFDTHDLPNEGRAVYMSVKAEQLEGDDVARGLEIFSAESVAQGLPEWTPHQVSPSARHRLYRAFAMEHYVLNDRDERIRVEL
jgi:nitroimidazol reductase NimA-like FMN-containing flavoprotein (pyridoxamine 5'-phosphate oxidase superfamily)